MCLSCHDEPGPANAVPHGGADGRCLDCHNPHNAAQDMLLHAPIEMLCARCHAAQNRAGTSRHEPIIKPESCASCHAPHGSTQQRLLTAPLAPTFYVPYSREAYALCFKCHEPKLVEQPQTADATRFRDGSRNLHTVHVMRTDKGRSCRACHEMHEAPNAALVASDVEFGSHGWRLKTGFRAAPEGGSCAKTCHLERSYSRNRTSARAER
jgi:predicted CXXCH cytochrome family protein